MSELAEQTRPLTLLFWISAATLVGVSVATYVGFEASVCPGDGGPEMAEASAQAIVCGEGDFYPWALVLWVVGTVGGVAVQWWATHKLLTQPRQLLGVLLPVALPLLLFAVLQLPSESCTDEVKRTEPPERCVEPD